MGRMKDAMLNYCDRRGVKFHQVSLQDIAADMAAEAEYKAELYGDRVGLTDEQMREVGHE